MAKTTSGKGVRRTSTKRAGLIYPVTRIGRLMKKGKYCSRLTSVAPVYLAAVMEYLCAEVIELAGNQAKRANRKTIRPRDIMLGIRNDEELNRLLKGVTIASSGVVPNIHAVLLPGAKH